MSPSTTSGVSSLPVEVLTQIIEAEEPILASEVVRFELLAGVRPREVDALELFFSVLSWVPVGEEVSRTAAALARDHRRFHSGIDDADYLIAATTLLLDAELLDDQRPALPDA